MNTFWDKYYQKPLDEMKDLKTSQAWGFSVMMASVRLAHFARWIEVYIEKETDIKKTVTQVYVIPIKTVVCLTSYFLG